MTAPRPRAPARGWAPELPSAAQWRAWNLDPAWSQLLDVVGHDGVTRRWHVLDTGLPTDTALGAATVVCVHGNPTWGYAWATFLRRFGGRHRVIAIDQLGMGYSERTTQRRYATRVRDLDDVIEALSIDDADALFVAAHDWGGAVAMGWAVDHAYRIAGMILCNTGIAVPAGRKAPAVIRLAASAPMLELVCHGTSTFVEGTLRLSGKRITAVDRSAFRAPYASAPARAAIADFVGDIPLKPGHPSEAALADVASRLGDVTSPVLLAWGSRDPVFNDDFAADLEARLPNTVLHRFFDANHLVMAEADVARVADGFIDDVLSDRLQRHLDDSADTSDRPVAVVPLWSAIDTRRHEQATAFVDMATGEQLRFDEFAGRIDAIAADLWRRGLRRGDRVAMLTPPGVDLVAAVYGVWRAGGVTVVADRGLGLKGLGAAVRGARVSWVVGPPRALRAARILRWASGAVGLDIDELVTATPGPLPAAPGGDDVAAVLFTSGATGPAKGVVYRHRQLAAQRDALARTYSISADDRLVAAFAPFAVYGPALGITTCLPDCDVTKPGQLTADALDAACSRVGATLAFGSPAALANVVATSTDRATWPGLAGLRIVLSAGAPVPVETLKAVAALAPAASLHTPYGMTEALPIVDIELADIELAEMGLAEIDGAGIDHRTGGVCVGRPVDGADVRIVAISTGDVSLDALRAGATGEILVAAPWVSDGYLSLWATERSARPVADLRWHRSGDVGHVDADGRLWVEGRSVHLIGAATGIITPVPVERTVERGLPIARSAAVGVGPQGRQQLVVVLEDADAPTGLAGSDITARVRALVEHPVAAVLSLSALPVDIRHNAKIDRTAVARWASDLLAGHRARAPK